LAPFVVERRDVFKSERIWEHSGFEYFAKNMAFKPIRSDKAR
jgi:hypothetical protein